MTEPEPVAAFGLLLVSVTTAPPAGAALPSVTLPVLPRARHGRWMTLTPTNGGFSVSVTILDAPTHVYVMLACVGTVTGVVVTCELAVVAPAGTVTEPEAGTLAFGVAARQRHHRAADWRGAVERHRAGACHRRRSVRKGSASTNPAACSRRARLFWRCQRKWR